MTTEALATDTASTESAAATAAAPLSATGAADTGQSQPDGQGAATGAAAETSDTAAKAEGAPEAYTFVAPEGQSFDEKTISAYSAIAKDLDLPQDKAQKMLETMAPAIVARQAERLEQVKVEWLDAAKIDKEYGGDKFEENKAFISKAREDLATPELRKLLDETGLGNHPEMARLFYRYGKAVSEDGFVAGRTVTQGGTAQSLYSKSNMNP